jgi:transcriptional regulator with XRE-family HTH domain
MNKKFIIRSDMTYNETISENLKTLLTLDGNLSTSELARKTNIPQPTLHRIIEGKTKNPRKEALHALAKFFSISVPQLIGTIPLSSNIPNIIKDKLKISTIPLIDWDSAKDWKHGQTQKSNHEEVIINKMIGSNAFALTLSGTEMEPLFQNKSILIFDPSKVAKERDFVLVYLDNLNTLIFNRLFIDDKNYYIKKEKKNGDADLFKLNFPKDKLIATLIESRMAF